MTMEQLILFYKPNKKVRSEKTMNHLISQIKHAIIIISIPKLLSLPVVIYMQLI
jgi:hypothetical protein